MTNTSYTLKDLQRETGAPHYIIQYLNQTGRLPVVKKSPGPGYPTFYGPEAVQIIINHIERRNVKQ